MSYSYGTQGAPAVGGGAPGLPSRWQPAASTYTRIVSGSGVLIPPQGAKFMRVAVIGGGGGAHSGARGSAGSGGGCAASKVVPVAPIQYSIGAGGVGSATQSATVGGTSTAQFLNYNLVATGGYGNAANLANSGGYGSGGDYNFTGGTAFYGSNSPATAGGGGGAGPGGNGGNGDQFNSSGDDALPVDSGWGCGGGGGGRVPNTSYAGGGGGAGAPGTDVRGSVLTFRQGGVIFGKPGTNPTGLVGNGGEMGGGGGVIGTGTSLGNGGSGGMVVEWFY